MHNQYCSLKEGHFMKKSANVITLYEAKDKYIPRVAAVHDICGYGKCSLTVAIPVLSVAGIDVCPVPTAIFSSHTMYPTYTMRDTTEDLQNYIDSWSEINVDIDAIYSGFLGSKDQIDIILELRRRYPHALMIIDPVMADHGKMYPTYTQELCDEMKRLAAVADVLTPNLTEAAFLTGLPYTGQSPNQEQIDELMAALLAMGAKYVILKGITNQEGLVTNVISGHDIGSTSVSGPLYPVALHGTGDLFASSLAAILLSGKDLEQATAFATEFVYRSIEISVHQPDFERRGVNFEPLLGDIARYIYDN